jgi:hypothetical protein
MPKSVPFEAKALEDAQILLKFAAENSPIADEVITTLAHSWDAEAKEQWTPDISAKFWGAYGLLCKAIRPVTLDTLACCNTPPPASARWQFWRSRTGVSRARATARIYLTMLIGFLILSILLQFSVSTANSLMSEIDKMKPEMDTIMDSVNPQMFPILQARKAMPLNSVTMNSDLKKASSNIQSAVQQIWLREDQIASKLKIVSLLTGTFTFNWNPGNYSPMDDPVGKYASERARYYENLRFISTREEGVSLIIKVINSTVLPLLLGIVGASAYVTRLISEQIKDTTFSSTSAIRHQVRVALGALAGVIVGFGWINSGISVSPLALAFIAGYSVEPVFATVDSIAEKFRRP